MSDSPFPRSVPESEYVTFEWADKGTETFVFKRAEIEAATEDILELNGIRAECSKDLRSTWATGR